MPPSDPNEFVQPRDASHVRHFMSDVDMAAILVSPDRGLCRALANDAVRTPSGHVSLGVLMTLIDVEASDPALATCRPDWVATQDFTLHGAGPIVEGPIVVDCRVVWVGSRVIVVESMVYDGHGVVDLGELQAAIDGSGAAAPAEGLTLAGTSLITFVRLPGSAATDVDDYNPAGWIGSVRHRRPEAAPSGTMYERMGLKVLDVSVGAMELAHSPYVSNSIGTINGGAQAVLVEAAAEAVRPGLLPTDLQVHYLSQVKVGPARTRASVVRDAPDHSVVDVTMVDAGNHDKILTLATVTLRRP